MHPHSLAHTLQNLPILQLASDVTQVGGIAWQACWIPGVVPWPAPSPSRHLLNLGGPQGGVVQGPSTIPIPEFKIFK